MPDKYLDIGITYNNLRLPDARVVSQLNWMHLKEIVFYGETTYYPIVGASHCVAIWRIKHLKNI
jgi:hypothetical protein